MRHMIFCILSLFVVKAFTFTVYLINPQPQHQVKLIISAIYPDGTVQRFEKEFTESRADTVKFIHYGNDTPKEIPVELPDDALALTRTDVVLATYALWRNERGLIDHWQQHGEAYSCFLPETASDSDQGQGHYLVPPDFTVRYNRSGVRLSPYGSVKIAKESLSD